MTHNMLERIHTGQHAMFFLALSKMPTSDSVKATHCIIFSPIWFRLLRIDLIWTYR